MNKSEIEVLVRTAYGLLALRIILILWAVRVIRQRKINIALTLAGAAACFYGAMVQLAVHDFQNNPLVDATAWITIGVLVILIIIQAKRT